MSLALCCQDDYIYTSLAKNVVASAIKGYNGCILSLGADLGRRHVLVNSEENTQRCILYGAVTQLLNSKFYQNDKEKVRPIAFDACLEFPLVRGQRSTHYVSLPAIYPPEKKDIFGVSKCCGTGGRHSLRSLLS